MEGVGKDMKINKQQKINNEGATSVTGFFLKTFPSLIGILPSTINHEGAENVDDSDSDGEDTFDKHGGGTVFPIWIPGDDTDYSAFNSSYFMKSISKDFIFEFTKKENEDNHMYTPNSFDIVSELLDETNLNLKNKKICLLKLAIFSPYIEGGYEAILKFKINVPHRNDNPCKPILKKVTQSGNLGLNIWNLFTIPKGYGFNEFKNGCGKERILKRIKQSKSGFQFVRKTGFIENHGNLKIHKSSFVGSWLKNRVYKQDKTGRPIKLYKTPLFEIQKKTYLKYKIQGDEIPNKAKVDKDFFCIENEDYDRLSEDLHRFFKVMPYVDRSKTNLITVSIEEITKKENAVKSSDSKIICKFKAEMFFSLSREKMDKREIVRHIIPVKKK